MPRDFLSFFKLSGTFILFLDAFESSSHQTTADGPYWFREEVHWIIDKIFRDELTS